MHAEDSSQPARRTRPAGCSAAARRRAGAACAAWLAGFAAAAAAQAPAPAVATPAPGAAAPAPEIEAAVPQTPRESASWEGALGVVAAYRPEYAGAHRTVVKLTPALFLRYGRWSISNAGGFVTRRADDVVRGLGLDMVQREHLRINLAARYDSGRREGDSAALAGLGGVKATVRARLQASWRPQGPWRLGASWSVDALRHGGGHYGDVSGGWESRVLPHTVANVGVVVSAAGRRYLQSYYGVTPEQSQRTGYAVYSPGTGLRDAAVFVNARHEIDADWVALAGASVSRLLGPAAHSPLTQDRSGWAINAGIARRF